MSIQKKKKIEGRTLLVVLLIIIFIGVIFILRFLVNQKKMTRQDYEPKYFTLVKKDATPTPHSFYEVNKNGYWKGLEASSQHAFDLSLAMSLTRFFLDENIKTVVDLGCGMGQYVETFRKYNIDADCFDGNPNTPELTKNLCGVLDLSIAKIFHEAYDWVLSLEVGEHLPPEFEDIFINNLHYNNKHGIILSWAIKGQGGHGHFNEQNNDYIKSKICSLGYWNDIESEKKLRKSATLPWFQNTIMVFRKKR